MRLLDRHRQGIEPTACGQALLDCGVAVFDDLRQGVKKIEFLTDPTAGEVRIGCHPFLAASFVSAVIDRVSRQYPRIVFRLVIAEVQTLHRELSDRKVDLLITRRWAPIADERLGFEDKKLAPKATALNSMLPFVPAVSIVLAQPWLPFPRRCGLAY